MLSTHSLLLLPCRRLLSTSPSTAARRTLSSFLFQWSYFRTFLNLTISSSDKITRGNRRIFQHHCNWSTLKKSFPCLSNIFMESFTIQSDRRSGSWKVYLETETIAKSNKLHLKPPIKGLTRSKSPVVENDQENKKAVLSLRVIHPRSLVTS